MQVETYDPVENEWRTAPKTPVKAGCEPSRSTPLISLPLDEYLAYEFPPREAMLGDWLTRQALVMIYAWRGTGKTYFGLEIGYAVSSALPFLGWDVPKPRKTLYVDAEMPGPLLQKRLARIVASSESSPAKGWLRVINPDLQKTPMPDLATVGGQAKVAESIEPDTELIILDSISALVRRGGRENEAESWSSVDQWALWQRSQGRTVIFIHHAGKSGAQRGTSTREDHLDVSICLQRPPQHEAKDGAVFEILWEKGRDLCGNALEPVEAALMDKDGKRVWTSKPVSATTYDRVISLANEGLTRPEICEELGVNRSNVWRAWKRAQSEGKIGRAK